MSASTQKIPTVYLLDGSIAVTGAFVCARNIARALAARANVVLVIPEGSMIGEEETRLFASVRRLPVRPLRRTVASTLTYLPSLLMSSFRLFYHMQRDQSRTLIVNDFYLMQGAVCRLLGFRGRVVTWVRINPYAFGRIGGLWLRLAKITSNRLISVSRYIQKLLPSEVESELAYDAVDPYFEEAVPTKPHANRTFVFVGNYIPGKGQDVAIEAMARVTQVVPEARIEFYGGDMGLAKNRRFRDQLIQRALQCGLEKHARFGGFVSDTREVLVGKFAALNLSQSESFSMAVLEASACGLPAIVTKSGGPQEIIDHNNTGYIIPVDDVGACADAMIWLCRDPGKAWRMGLAGRNRVLRDFSQAAFRRRLIALLELD